MKTITHILLCCCSLLWCQDNSTHSLVFVHIGNKMPKHVEHSIAQARLFNPKCPIFLLCGNALPKNGMLSSLNVTTIGLESLDKSSHHKLYAKQATTEGFWRYALERFFFIDDFIQQYKMKNVFHIENDVMIYFCLAEHLPVFEKLYGNMLATVFDCDQRAVPSFVYLPNQETSSLLTQFIANHNEKNTTDMHLLNEFKKNYHKKRADHLPILIPSYAKDYPMLNILKERSKSAHVFSRNLGKFKMIFDAATLGQYFGGIDPILGHSQPGFMGESSIFLPMFFSFDWQRDKAGRWIPYIAYNGERYPIANLHIHCKDLARFSSKNDCPPALPTSHFSSLPFNHIRKQKRR